MSTQVAGVLRDPFERPLANTDIDIRAITNTFAILPGNTIKVTTNAQGEYNFILEPANYAVSVILDGRSVYQGAISVTSTTAPGTLPELLKQAEMLAELPLNYGEYFQQIQATVKDDADRAQSAADSVGNELALAQQAAQEAQQSSSSAAQSEANAEDAYQKTKVISDKYQDIDNAVTETQQNAAQTTADAQNTSADRQAAEAAAQRAEDAADSAETVNERNVRVPQGETINALPSAASRASSVAAFDSAGQSVAKKLSDFAILDGTGKVPLANIPAAAITEVFPVSSQAAMLALTADPGDVAIINNTTTPSENGSFILMSSPASTLSNWKYLSDNVLVQLAMSTGANKIGFGQSNVYDSLLLNVRFWGAKGNGTTDDAAAFNSALKYAADNNKTKIRIPAGRYILGSTLSPTFTTATSFTFEGDGSEATILDFASGVDGFSLKAQTAGGWWMDVGNNTALGFHFEGMTIMSRGSLASVGITMNIGIVTGRPSYGVTFEDVVFRGYQTFTTGWGKCISATDTGNIFFHKCRFFMGGPDSSNQSIGIELLGTANGNPAEVYMNHCEGFYGGTWITAGNNIEGLRLTNCTVIGKRAVNWNATAESGLCVIGGHYNCSVYGFNLNGVFDVAFSGVNIYNEGNAESVPTMITLLNGGRMAVSGCVFSGSVGLSGTSRAIFIGSSAGGEPYGSIISGNSFHNFTLGAIHLGSGSAFTTIGANAYRACTQRVIDNTGNNFIQHGSYSRSGTISTTGGGTSEAKTITLPSGMLITKPASCIVQLGDFSYLAVADDNASTKDKIVFNIRRVDGATITAGVTLKYNIIFTDY